MNIRVSVAVEALSLVLGSLFTGTALVGDLRGVTMSDAWYILFAIPAGIFWSAGFIFGRYHQRSSPVHEHAYGLWEECLIRDGKYRQGKWVEDLVAGQRRDCLGCGERQVRTVTTQEAV
ncbi:hypothetical protein PROPHIGD102-1_34 [Mycobacterium phage prophiGD102-1]|nr:hypothetical protein PROPHIGD102-1_34 [Mycobacterium phage prophiGD102-1]